MDLNSIPSQLTPEPPTLKRIVAVIRAAADHASDDARTTAAAALTKLRRVPGFRACLMVRPS
jgi:hypothetical protein